MLLKVPREALAALRVAGMPSGVGFLPPLRSALPCVGRGRTTPTVRGLDATLPGHEAEAGGKVQECGCNRERTLEANSSVYADAKEDSWQPQHLQGFNKHTVPLGPRQLLGAGT